MHDDLKKKALGRVEFLAALIHIAILRYVSGPGAREIDLREPAPLKHDDQPLVSGERGMPQ